MKKLTLTMLGAMLLFSTAVRAQETSIKGYASVKAVATKTDGNFWIKKSSNRKCPQRKEASEKLLPRCYPQDFLRIEPTWKKEELNK